MSTQQKLCWCHCISSWLTVLWIRSPTTMSTAMFNGLKVPHCCYFSCSNSSPARQGKASLCHAEGSIHACSFCSRIPVTVCRPAHPPLPRPQGSSCRQQQRGTASACLCSYITHLSATGKIRGRRTFSRRLLLPAWRRIAGKNQSAWAKSVWMVSQLCQRVQKCCFLLRPRRRLHRFARVCRAQPSPRDWLLLANFQGLAVSLVSRVPYQLGLWVISSKPFFFQLPD